MGFLSDSTAKIHLSCRRCGFSPWVGKLPWRGKWQPTPAFLPGKSYGWRSLAAYSPWGRKSFGHNLTAKQQQQTTSTGRRRKITFSHKVDAEKVFKKTQLPFMIKILNKVGMQESFPI